jgi:hypothetical protein
MTAIGRTGARSNITGAQKQTRCVGPTGVYVKHEDMKPFRLWELLFELGLQRVFFLQVAATERMESDKAWSPKQTRGRLRNIKALTYKKSSCLWRYADCIWSQSRCEL